jgi:hypothetical protein
MTREDSWDAVLVLDRELGGYRLFWLIIPDRLVLHEHWQTILTSHFKHSVDDLRIAICSRLPL